MSGSEDRQSQPVIVIVRRRSGGHGDGHHGGAWKIAFADFMTALMCFFLVMWLVNASDKQTITQIATYFNPIRLNDRAVSRKGLDDPDAKPPPESPKDKTKVPAQSEKPAVKEKARQVGAVGDKTGHATNADRVLAGEVEMIRDPYGMLQKIVASEPAARRADPVVADGKPSMPKDFLDTESVPRRTADRAQKQPPQKSQGIPQGLPETRKDLTADRLMAEIANSIAKIEVALKPTIEVSDLGNEVLISISDNGDHSMFGIGSSRPTSVLVQVMDAVGRVLEANGGAVVLRGHTDARPYSGGAYDNWRLSSARAQIAYHMLVRGGLSPSRVKRIEGHADKSLRSLVDPLAPQNRRIEILVAKERS